MQRANSMARRRGLWLIGVVCAVSGMLGLTPDLRAAALAPTTVAAMTAQTQVPAAGAPHPDVVIVEYLDYNCPYCRKSAPELQKLLHTDPRVAIIFKEWPIFGDASVYAARSALAANWQGKFLVAHDALIGSTRDLDQNADVDAVLRAAGLDLRRLEADRQRHSAWIDALLARSARETHGLGLQGTPVFVIGRQLILSAVSFAQLQGLVARVRVDQAAAH